MVKAHVAGANTGHHLKKCASIHRDLRFTIYHLRLPIAGLALA